MNNYTTKVTIFLFVLCVALCAISCSVERDESKNSSIKSGIFTFEKKSNVELEQQLVAFLNKRKTRASFNGGYGNVNNFSQSYAIATQEVLRNTQTNEELVVVRSCLNSNNVMAFHRENGKINNCLIVECQLGMNVLSKEIPFVCKDENGIPLFDATLSQETQTFNVTHIFDEMSNVDSSQRNWGCNVSLGLCGALWSTAFGMVTAGAGFVVGIAWTIFQTWACSSPSLVMPKWEYCDTLSVPNDSRKYEKLKNNGEKIIIE